MTAVCFGIALLALATTSCDSPPAAPAARPAAALPAPRPASPDYSHCLSNSQRIDSLRFQPGDHLDGLLRRGGVPAGHRMELARAVAEVYDLGRFRSGAPLFVHRDGDGAILGIHYPMDFEQDLCAWRQRSGFQAAVFRADLDWSARHLRADLEGSFYESLLAQGEQGDLATRVADLFAGEVDFFFDLRRGDIMEILVESAQRPDRGRAHHRVLAARLVLQDELHEAYLFPDSSGTRHYYHRDGSSLERQFLRAPLNFVRVSSGFSHSRLHPILRVRRPHPGVDYAAPTGTPIMATADGVVKTRSRNSQAGRYIKLRHPGDIETAYLHLSRFAGGTSPGQRVRKGQVIGYVGKTGLATGPHLDYRMKIRGQYVDPRRYRSEPAAPLPESQWEAFRARVAASEALWTRLREDRERAPTAASQKGIASQAAGGLPFPALLTDSLSASSP